MREESIPDFPRPSPFLLIQGHIESELKRKGISLQRIGIQGKTYTVITDVNVPKEIKSNICRHSACKGIIVKFQTRE